MKKENPSLLFKVSEVKYFSVLGERLEGPATLSDPFALLDGVWRCASRLAGIPLLALAKRFWVLYRLCMSPHVRNVGIFMVVWGLFWVGIYGIGLGGFKAALGRQGLKPGPAAFRKALISSLVLAFLVVWLMRV